MKMSKEDREDLRRYLEEGCALHLHHQYEDEEDFEEKFGRTDTLEEAADLYVDCSDFDDVKRVFETWVKDFPDSRQELLDLFGIEEEKTPNEVEGKIIERIEIDLVDYSKPYPVGAIAYSGPDNYVVDSEYCETADEFKEFFERIAENMEDSVNVRINFDIFDFADQTEALTKLAREIRDAFLCVIGEEDTV